MLQKWVELFIQNFQGKTELCTNTEQKDLIQIHPAATVGQNDVLPPVTSSGQPRAVDSPAREEMEK